MRVCLSGLFYPVAILRYFESALRRRNDIELFTIGPYTGSWIPWNGGMTLPPKYAIQPDVVLPTGGDRPQPKIMIDWAQMQVPFKPDLWIQVDAGFYFVGKPQYGKNVIIATDPHVLNYDAQRAYADTFYCMQACYAKPGDEYLPYAYDPIWHAPEKQPRNYDAALIGLHYENRNKLVDRLRERGLNVFYDLGPSFDEARAIYNQADIGLNWSSLNDLTARVFELLGMKRLAVVNRVPDLHKFFMDGRELVVFDNLNQAVEQVVYYHENPVRAKRIAERGHKAVQAHTWDARIEQILGDV